MIDRNLQRISIAEAAATESGKTSLLNLLAMLYGALSGLMLLLGTFMYVFTKNKDQFLLTTALAVMAGCFACAGVKSWMSKKSDETVVKSLVDAPAEEPPVNLTQNIQIQKPTEPDQV